MERRKLEESKDPMMLVATRSVKQPKGDSAGKWKIRQLVGEGDGDGDGQQGRLLGYNLQASVSVQCRDKEEDTAYK